jgi:hypothetical protein
VWVSPTNFASHDEWLLLWLTDKGVLSVPYANRPLVLFWNQPASLLFDNRLTGYWLLHGIYLSAVGLVVLAFGRRLLPSQPQLTFLAAAISVVWAPLDALRLDSVLLVGYAGNTLATFAAALVFLESWRRASPALLAAAVALAVVAVRAGEITLPLLGAAPACLLLLERRPSRRMLAWAAVWEVALLAASLTAILAVVRPAEATYQTAALGFDPHPVRVAARLARQLGLHLLPLAGPWPPGSFRVATLLATACFAAGYVAVVLCEAEPPREPRRVAVAALGGFAAAVLSYLPYALTPSVAGPDRTQILSAPGVAWLLAACAAALSGPLPRLARTAAMGLLGAWVVASGTAHVLHLQRLWHATSFWPAQSGTLRALTRLAPDLRPNTFVLLLDGAGTWPATFSFRHAVDYVYGGRAIGAVWGGQPFLYPFGFTTDGLLVEPWPVIRPSWGVRPSFHRYDEVVVVRLSASGLALVDRWPDAVLPPLPGGARYDPASRIVAPEGKVPRARRILETP